MLHFGQPSPLRCILLSPQGLAILWGPLLPRPESQKRRLPGAGLDDADKVPQAHFMWGLLQTNSRKSRCRDYGFDKQLFVQTAPPPQRGRGTGWGQIRRGYLWSASVRSTDLFFPIIEGKTIFVSSTAKRQRGLQRGKLGSPLPCFASFCRSKRKAPAASGVNYAFAKGSTPPIGDHKLSPRRAGVQVMPLQKAPPRR